MVRVSLVPEDDPNAPAPEESTQVALDFSDDESAFDSDDDFDANETLAERVAALRDIVPPAYRAQLARGVNGVSSLASAVASFGGKSLWTLTSSTLLLAVPLSLCIVAEQQEAGMQMTDSTNSVLAPGAEEGFQKPAAI